MARWSATLAALAAVLVLTTAAEAAPTPYGTDDAGGFRNVLPPGTNGLVTALDLGANLATGAFPEHYRDQQPLYDGLIQKAPALDRAGLEASFKDATFGIAEGDVASTTVPRPGVTILRDKGYGVPHVYGETRADVMFGAGYAGAQDRLFLMDVLRHTGRAQLSSFAGGSAGNRRMDREQWELAPYTEADLQRQVDQAEALYGADGKGVIDDVTAYVAGINAYIDEAKTDPRKMPAEYAALGRSAPDPWKVTDVIATASLIGGIFGKGGGAEVRSALVLRALERQLGRKAGRKAWRSFRMKDDPEAPTTVRQRFPYQREDALSPRGLALPDPGSVTFTPTAPPPEAQASAASARSAGRFADLGAQLRRAIDGRPHASNWLVVSGKESASGHPIGVLGPQVGYYVPQILMEQELHGPGIDAAGAAFPGVNLYVQLGHGRDYAWSATSAGSDNVDTFAEVLCDDDVHYLYKGECRAMEKLERTNSWRPTVADDTPAGSETLTAYRTVHGIVYARGTVGGKKVAFARARTTYFHEADSALGFSRLNDPGFVKDAESFKRAADAINFTFNWAYLDGEDTAYYQSGWYPRRAKRTSPDLPVLGTGAYDWQGFDPATFTSRRLGFAEHPQAVNAPYEISWNNKQAPRWAAADDQFGYGPLYRSQLLERYVKARTAGDRRITTEELVQSMALPATQDIRGVLLVPRLAKAIGTPKDERARAALQTLREWAARGAHRRDLDGDGTYEDDAAVTLMDAWWPRLVRAMFESRMGPEAFKAVQALLPVGDEVEGADPNAPAFSQGWWGYVQKDLRATFNRKRPPGWSRRFCGGGSKAKCRAALEGSLVQALSVPRTQLYGRGACEQDADAECFDRNRSTVAAAVGLPPMPFQNRPTFQQVVEVTRRLAR
ncbi:MAG: penicillin acylase family protein [Solirubrobacterales bacterium]|nr:penicillin acylase family protein [Solirubrobacterales bacterium]